MYLWTFCDHFSGKIRLGISCESSIINIKCRLIFSEKITKTKCSDAVLIRALTVIFSDAIS